MLARRASTMRPVRSIFASQDSISVVIILSGILVSSMF